MGLIDQPEDKIEQAKWVVKNTTETTKGNRMFGRVRNSNYGLGLGLGYCFGSVNELECMWAIPRSVALHFSVSFLDLGARSSM